MEQKNKITQLNLIIFKLLNFVGFLLSMVLIYLYPLDLYALISFIILTLILLLFGIYMIIKDDKAFLPNKKALSIFDLLRVFLTFILTHIFLINNRFYLNQGFNDFTYNLYIILILLLEAYIIAFAVITFAKVILKNKFELSLKKPLIILDITLSSITLGFFVIIYLLFYYNGNMRFSTFHMIYFFLITIPVLLVLLIRTLNIFAKNFSKTIT